MRLGNFSVSLAVKDLAASRAFYEKLGFRAGHGNGKNWLVMQNDTTKIGLFPRAVLSVYASVLSAVALLAAIRFVTDDLIVVASAVLAAALLLPWFNRRFLDIGGTFPELARIPLLGRMLCAPSNLERVPPAPRPPRSSCARREN